MGIVTTLENLITNKMSSVSNTSKAQIEKINKRRGDYLIEESSSQDGKILGSVAVETYHSYIPSLDKIYTPIDNCSDLFHDKQRILFFNIVKWVHDKNEKSIEKLVNVYQTASDGKYNIALIFNRDESNCSIYLALADVGNKDNRDSLIEAGKGIECALLGNFPGAEIESPFSEDSDKSKKNGERFGMPPCFDYLKNQDGPCAVAIVSNIPSEKSENFNSQRMEKLLDGIVPTKGEHYTLVLLASPCKKQNQMKMHLYDQYSSLSQFAEWQTNQNTGESFGVGTSGSMGANLNTGIVNSFSAGFGINGIGINASTAISTNVGLQFSYATNESLSLNKSEGVTKNHVNYGIKHTLDNIELQIRRLEECTAMGMWEFAAYVVSDSPVLAKNVSTMYLALTQGENSYIGTSAINFYWNKQDDDIGKTAQIINSLKRLRHPLFTLSHDIVDEDKNWLLYPAVVDATMILSSKELARALNFPKKSVCGLPVFECASFGREVQYLDVRGAIDKKQQIDIGSVYHMHKVDGKRVVLDMESLTSHTLVTGSTGTGKSTLMYQLVDKLLDEGKKILVIEPAKGEYKKIVGGRFNHVYGTNQRYTELLKINPFIFPKNIHVLEHIDRLVEVLNACWPMYAAMPAVLKDSIERAYIRRGWNLSTSKSYLNQYPTFFDVIETLPLVMSESAYSSDTKGDYMGALMTRIKSLTNGINGTVFCSEDNVDLFKENNIVDLSRVGSSETKSLIMGIIIMSLQEYHINNGGTNEKLKHVTVLEEAHNLLRKPISTNEGSNIQGRSVEMISSSIAEMRTYGEAFFIVDQSPALLDESVIRNTNTKIIFRIPDESDRELVGKASALTRDQIDEIAKFPRGVASVFQNNWIESVLCGINDYKKKNGFNYAVIPEMDMQVLLHDLFSNLFDTEQNQPLKIDPLQIEHLNHWVQTIPYPSQTKQILMNLLEGKSISNHERRIVAYNLFQGKKILKNLYESKTEQDAIKSTDEMINKMYNLNDYTLSQSIRNHIIQMACSEYSIKGIEHRYKEYIDIRGHYV